MILRKYREYVCAFSMVVAIFTLSYFFPSQASAQQLSNEYFSQLDVRSATLRKETLNDECESLKTLHKKRGVLETGDWLSSHVEKGQSCAAYKKTRPNRPDKTKKFIYIQLIGSFNKAQLKVLDQTLVYMHTSFGLPIVKMKAVALNQIAVAGRRHHALWGNEQLHTRYIMKKILLPRRPKDAVALIAFTATDLYPDEKWNFVFGSASLKQRIGVWSIYRNGDPAKSAKDFILCLRRTIKTAIHETGHILGIKHCIAYECLMNGSNSREESDSRELYYCPSCLYKLSWNTNKSSASRF
ncbi:MAG: hypothetical protein HRT88_20800, partial [Lentisphaeraceae bacterium]|nr:hypothetical protein [Lentisphaeraceae bacterium]